MKKAHFLCLLILSILVSCNKKTVKRTTDVTGKINNVSVIIDDELWNGEVGDSVRNKFASPVLGLPQEEPNFTLNQYPVKLLEGFMSNSRNIIVIKKAANSQFKIIKNEYVSPQVVVHISGRTVQELLDSIQSNDSLIIQSFKKSEIEVSQKQLLLDSVNYSQKLSEKFSIRIPIPLKYKMVMYGKKFVWFKKEITSGNVSLMFYELPITSIKTNQNIINQIVKKRDSIGNIYIHGAVPKTRMITEKAFSPYLSETKIYGKKTYETKGNWELLHESMGGPFINYAIIDEKNNRILVIEGFCYAPSKKKRDLMFELESIIKSVQFLKRNK